MNVESEKLPGREASERAARPAERYLAWAKRLEEGIGGSYHETLGLFHREVDRE